MKSVRVHNHVTQNRQVLSASKFTNILHMILIDFLIWVFFRPQNANSDHVPAFYTQEDRGTS